MQAVNTQLGTSKNPVDEKFNNEKLDSIRSRLGYVTGLKTNLGRTGQAKSIDLNNFTTVRQFTATSTIFPAFGEATTKRD